MLDSKYEVRPIGVAKTDSYEGERRGKPAPYRLLQREVDDLRLVFGGAEARAGFSTNYFADLIGDANRRASGSAGEPQVHIFDAERWCDSMKVYASGGPSARYHACQRAVAALSTQDAVVLYRVYGVRDPFFYTPKTIEYDPPLRDEAQEERSTLRWPEMRVFEEDPAHRLTSLVLFTDALGLARRDQARRLAGERITMLEVSRNHIEARSAASKRMLAFNDAQAAAEIRHSTDLEVTPQVALASLLDPPRRPKDADGTAWETLKRETEADRLSFCLRARDEADALLVAASKAYQAARSRVLM